MKATPARKELSTIANQADFLQQKPQ